MTDKRKLLGFVRLRQVEPLMDWEDIKVGETYHIPPLIYNKRMDFVVKEKTKNAMKVIKVGDEYAQTMFRTDITTRFIVKKIELHAN